ncbi:MAG: HAD hydrolase family protein [Anaerovoracaceae bacterium]
MAIKLVALDLDGTTLNNDRVISERTRKALREAEPEA